MAFVLGEKVSETKTKSLRRPKPAGLILDEYKEFAKNNHEYVDPKTGAKVTVQFFIGGKYD